MRIEKNINYNTCRFKEIKKNPEIIFKFFDSIYMCLYKDYRETFSNSCSVYNVVNLEDGRLDFIQDEAFVEPLKSKLVIESK